MAYWNLQCRWMPNAQGFVSAGHTQGSSAILVEDRYRYRFRRGYRSPTIGVRLPEKQTHLRARCEAMALAVGGLGVFSDQTAVRVWDGVEAREERIELTVADDSHPVRRRGLRVRRRSLAPHDVVDWDGLRVTTPQRSFVDVAERLWLPSLVAVGDDFLRRGLCTSADIGEVLARSVGQRGVRRARQAWRMLDERAESPRESMTRAIIVMSGLPTPTPQVEIYGADGHFIARGDLAYVAERIVIEYDGYHHLTREQQAKDAHRRGELAIEDWLMVTIVPMDISTPRLLVSKVRRALASRSPH
jgi:hypothetical protein